MTETTDLLLRVNGVHAAFDIEFGSLSARAEEGRREPYRQANVSYSLVQRRNAEIVRHTLIDVGMGVAPSLLELEATHGVHCVHEVFLTHPHFDHFAQIDWLSVALMRNGRAGQPRPLPIYASRECWETGPHAMFPYLHERSDFRSAEPGSAVELDDLRVVPFAVDHGPAVAGAQGFLVWYGDRRIVLSGDFQNIPDEDNPLFEGADVCFLEANTWHPIERIAHQSVLGNLRLIQKWKPKRTYFIHYSGYEDREYADERINGPLSLAQFDREVSQLSEIHDIQAARHGMILGDDVPWPT